MAAAKAKGLRLSGMVCSALGSAASPSLLAVSRLVLGLIRPAIAYGMPIWLPPNKMAWAALQRCLSEPLRRCLRLPRCTHRLSIWHEAAVPDLLSWVGYIGLRFAARLMQLPPDVPARKLLDLYYRWPLQCGVALYRAPLANWVMQQEQDHSVLHREVLYKKSEFREWWLARVAEVNHDRLIYKLKGGAFEVSPFLRHDGAVVASLRCHLRLNRAALNDRAFKWKRLASPACSCGAAVESASHVLLDCPLFVVPRSVFLQALQQHGLGEPDVLFTALGELQPRFLNRSSKTAPLRASSAGRSLLVAGSVFLLAIHQARSLV
jgi:hypothetical protein